MIEEGYHGADEGQISRRHRPEHPVGAGSQAPVESRAVLCEGGGVLCPLFFDGCVLFLAFSMGPAGPRRREGGLRFWLFWPAPADFAGPAARPPPRISMQPPSRFA